MALGVVQREHAGPPRLGGVELGEQLLERQRAPVLVEAQVRVGVDHFGAGRAQARSASARNGASASAYSESFTRETIFCRGVSEPGHRPTGVS